MRVIKELERMMKMEETFCGKSCSECGYKAKLSCPGCHSGPGASGGDCAIAKCCRKNGLTTCDGCIWHGECSVLSKKGAAPQERIERKKKETAESRKQRTYEVLAQWLPVLFWLVIGSTVVGVLAIEEVMELIPSVRWPVLGVLTVADVAYALILLRLAEANDRYLYAGVGGLLSAVLGLIGEIFVGAGWLWIITAVEVIPAFIKEFQEHLAHADVVEPLDRDLAEKWRRLWLWRFGLLMTPVFCLVLAFILPGLATLLTLAAVVGSLIVSLIKIGYIYKTSAAFREHDRYCYEK
jgi:hypothetical protein